MDAVEYLKTKQRMCSCLRSDCGICPMRGCGNLQKEEPEKAVRLEKEWGEKNPVVTNKMKFKEVFGLDEPPGITIKDLHMDESGVTLELDNWLAKEYKAP